MTKGLLVPHFLVKNEPNTHIILENSSCGSIYKWVALFSVEWNVKYLKNISIISVNSVTCNCNRSQGSASVCTDSDLLQSQKLLENIISIFKHILENKIVVPEYLWINHGRSFQDRDIVQFSCPHVTQPVCFNQVDLQLIKNYNYRFIMVTC